MKSQNKTTKIQKKQTSHKHDILQRKRKKRNLIKKKETVVNHEQNSINDVKQTKNNHHPLNGITIAISTLDTGKQHKSIENSYKYVKEECQAAGASITGQVSKKVFAVICNRSAVNQCTQRVRKALKQSIMLLDISWVRDSVKEKKRKDCEAYILNDLATEVFQRHQDKKKKDSLSINDYDTCLNEKEVNDITNVEFISDVGMIPTTGWSEPVSNGCCCVCHENGDLNCKWCTSPLCDINEKLFANKKADQLQQKEL